jgi:PPOX class probable FMN-dependent enzyme
VVFRGFTDNNHGLEFVTDRRSEKMDQIARNPWTEVCWYFPKTREQFRLSGQLTAIGSGSGDRDLDALRHRAWQELSDRAKTQFFWPEPGGERSAIEAFVPPDPIPETAPPPFVLLLLAPEWVDHLQLLDGPHHRRIYSYQSDGRWRDRAVNP